MTQLTDEKVVRSAYPDSCCDYLGGYFRIWRTSEKIAPSLSFSMRSEEAAWRYAATLVRAASAGKGG